MYRSVSNESKISRNSMIDVFRLVCAFLVVAIHTEPFYDINYYFGFVVNGLLVRIAVPFFFVVSGYYYFKGLNKHGIRYAYCYLKKLLIEYGIWTIIYYIIDFINLPAGASILSFLKSRIINFVIFGSHYHLWFYPALLISIAVITFFYKTKTVNVLFLMTLPLYVFGVISTTYPPPTYTTEAHSVLQQIINFPYFESIRRIFLMGLPFCVLGYFLSEYTERKGDGLSKKTPQCLIVSVLLYVAESAIIMLFHFENPILLFALYPLTAFTVLCLISCKKQFMFGNICKSCSSFIYFIHPIIILLVRMVLEKITFPYAKTATFFLTCIISFVIALIAYHAKCYFKKLRTVKQ